MEERKRNKGGRPRKKHKRNEQLAVMCTAIERRLISAKAKTANLTISEFLRSSGINQEVNVKHLPKDVLEMSAKLNGIAANINQIAKVANATWNISTESMESFQKLIQELTDISSLIKDHLK